MESVGFFWTVLRWLSEMFEFFTILQGDLGPAGFKMRALSLAGFSL